MNELILEPFAARIYFHLQPNPSPGQGQKILAGCLQAIAEKCEAAGNSLIGHIKAIALFPDGTYFRVSVVGAKHPAETDGNASADITDSRITLNILVYGLPRSRLHQIVEQSALEVGRFRNCEISILPLKIM